jgi:hypothetical protein
MEGIDEDVDGDSERATAKNINQKNQINKHQDPRTLA